METAEKESCANACATQRDDADAEVEILSDGNKTSVPRRRNTNRQLDQILLACMYGQQNDSTTLTGRDNNHAALIGQERKSLVDQRRDSGLREASNGQAGRR